MRLNKLVIACVVGSIAILPAIAPSCAKAEFEISNLTITPQEVEGGQSATISVDITNSGGAEGTYPVILKIDGVQIDEQNATIAPGATQQASFIVVREEAGSYTIDVNGLNATLTVLKALRPAEFEVSALSISPTEVVVGEQAVVTTAIENIGEVEGTNSITLRINGVEMETKEVTLAAGAKQTVVFTITRGTPGIYQVDVDGVTRTLKVVMPAELRLTSMFVMPSVTEPGEAVTVEVEVMNVGETEGSYALTLTVNGVEEEIKDVTVAPRTIETVSFTLVRDVSGLYGIEVAGLADTLRVRNPDAYPRLGNYYVGPTCFFQHPWSIEPAQLSSLARWDLIVVRYDVVRSAPESIQFIKELNPQAKILAWITAGLCDYRYYQLRNVQNRNESWFLHYGDTPGNPRPPEQRRVILWTHPTTGEELAGMNPASEWSTYLPNYVHDELMSSGLFDGVFYDCVWETMWKTNIDIDNDGIADSSTKVNQEYQKGMTQLLKSTRELLGPEAIIFGNPGVQWSEDSPYFVYANGHMQENALGTETWSSHDFPEIWDIYRRNMQKPAPPPRIHWIAVDTSRQQYNDVKPDLPPADLQKMRFGLAITLLGNGYFGFDIGVSHSQLWWFPEYDANLGLAKGDAQQRSDGTWMREFENGIVIANPTNKDSTIEFPAIYKDVTTGIESSHFVIAPKDGRIFLGM